MKRFSVLIVLLGFLFFGIGNAQIDTQTIAGWRITQVRGNVDSASTMIVDTISQSFHVKLGNYDDSAYVMWGKKLDRSYTTPQYIEWSEHFEGAEPSQFSMLYQFFIGSDSTSYSLTLGIMNYGSGSNWNKTGSDVGLLPNPPDSFDSIFVKVFTNGKAARGGFRGIDLYYGHKDPSDSSVIRLDSTIHINIFGDKATAIDVSRETLPQTFQLSQNYPNPFNPTTSIRYMVSSITNVKLTVYDILGREIAVLVNEEKPAGTYEVTFNVSNLSSGTYFYRLTATSPTGEFVLTKKMILLR